jgi:hypothetical protein
MGKTYRKEKQGKYIVGILEAIKFYYTFLKTNKVFEQTKHIFWHFFCGWIGWFYSISSPEVIRAFGIGIIKDLLKNNDILDLVDENNKAYRLFLTLNEDELMDLSFLNEKYEGVFMNSIVRKTHLKKIVKCLLPYGIVRLIQKRR